VFVELGLNISPDVKVSLRKRAGGSNQGGHFDLVLDPEGTTWDVLQSGAGYFWGTRAYCPPVGRLVLEFRRPRPVDSPVGRALLSVGTLHVDLHSGAVNCGAGLDVVPCTAGEGVWRHLVDVDGGVEERRRVPYRRFGIVVAFADKLKVLQRTLVSKVGAPCSIHPRGVAETVALFRRMLPCFDGRRPALPLLGMQLGERTRRGTAEPLPDGANVLAQAVHSYGDLLQGNAVCCPPPSFPPPPPTHPLLTTGCGAIGLRCAGHLASDLMVAMSPVLRRHVHAGIKGYKHFLNSVLVPSDAKNCLIELLCGGVVSGRLTGAPP
jgi:hypothetical protein